jgi:hypothetical protein
MTHTSIRMRSRHFCRPHTCQRLAAVAGWWYDHGSMNTTSPFPWWFKRPVHQPLKTSRNRSSYSISLQQQERHFNDCGAMISRSVAGACHKIPEALHLSKAWVSRRSWLLASLDYTGIRHWKATRICTHSDWVWGYFVNFNTLPYTLANNSGDSVLLKDLRGIMTL